MLKTSLTNYSDAYILVKGTISAINHGIAATPNNRNIKYLKILLDLLIAYTEWTIHK